MRAIEELQRLSSLPTLRRRSRSPHRTRFGGQIIRPIPLERLSPRVAQLVLKARKPWITRNSSCPCGSGKRFKRCCLSAK
jgi:hypothetical protein